MLFHLFFALSNPAHAVPLQITQQGKMIDPNGSAINGSHLVIFRIYTEETGGSLLWDETLTVQFNNGYYATVLGSDEIGNPLDSQTLSLYPVYLELQFDSNPPMSPRQQVNSVPYAQMAGIAESVDGGTVNAAEVQIGSIPVIDGNRNWVGEPITVDWSSIQNIPATITDGDDNTQLNESEVENFVTNDGLSLHEDTTLNGEEILTLGMDSDTLADISCSGDDVPKWDAVVGKWDCAFDNDTLADLNCSAGELAKFDGSDWLCSDEIDYSNLSNMPSDLQSFAELQCSDEESIMYSSSDNGWICNSSQNTSSTLDTFIGTSDGGYSYTKQYSSPPTVYDANVAGYTSMITIPQSDTITTFSIDLDITHPEMSDLSIKLTSPAGTEVILLDGSLTGQSDFNGNVGWKNSIQQGNVYSFYGEDTQGNWNLQVVDSVSGNQGTVNGWTLYFNENWDGTLFVGDELTVQGDTSVRGELRVDFGGDLVLSDSNGNETLRLDAESPQTIFTSTSYPNSVYVNTDSVTQSAETGPSVSVLCETGDTATGGGCDLNQSWAPLSKNTPVISNGSVVGWSCRAYEYNASSQVTLTAHVICLDLTP